MLKPQSFRLLPVVIAVAALTFGVKIGDIWSGASAAFAEDQAPAAAPAAAPAPAVQPAKAEPAPAAAFADTAAADPSAPYSQGELQLLENLSDRRTELDKRGEALDTRERVLDAMEQRIDQKIAEVKRIEAEVSGYLKTYDQKHIENMQTLVKMYESMKPKDAARIFDELQMDILVEVAGNMKERKMADILAAMKPDVAKALTTELATKKPIPLIAAN